MFKPAGLVTLFRPNWRQPKKLPKPLVVVFVLVQLFFGINYGFFAAITNRRLRALANLGSAMSFLLILTACAYNLSKNGDWVTGVLSAVHYLFLFITMRISKYTIYNFLTDLSEIDVRIHIEVNSYISLKTSLYLLFEFCFKLSMSLLLCLQIVCFDKGSLFLIFFVIREIRIFLPFLSTSVNILMFNGIHHRLQYLKAAFQENSLQIKEIEMIYKDLSDCLSKIRASQDTIIVLEFAVNFIKCVAIVWIHLKILKESPELLNSIFSFINTLALVIQICLPAVSAELIGVQIDNIMWLAHERLLIEIDEDNSEALLQLLRYVEARPLTYKAWRLVPVDLRLPVSLLSMSATYLVVLVQLTHLY